MDEAKGMADDFTGITATKAELREGGYFHQAKLIVLRDLWREKEMFAFSRRRGNKTDADLKWHSVTESASTLLDREFLETMSFILVSRQ